jgi:hypothetical protein
MAAFFCSAVKILIIMEYETTKLTYRDIWFSDVIVSKYGKIMFGS